MPYNFKNQTKKTQNNWSLVDVFHKNVTYLKQLYKKGLQQKNYCD